MKRQFSLWQIAFSLILLVGFKAGKAQISISHQLLGTTGNSSSGGGVMLSSSCGEIATSTFFSSSRFLTQGFQQPTSDELSIQVSSINSTCLDADNGYADVQVKSGLGPFQFKWEPGGQTTASIVQLKPGKYYLKVTDSRGFSIRDSVLIQLDFDGACGLHIYSGLTPNGDNQNDTWIIDGIEEFPENEVSIYNRWGDKVWGKKAYNNSTHVWNGNNSQNEALPDGTYFYLVTVSGKKYKGWVELSH